MEEARTGQFTEKALVKHNPIEGLDHVQQNSARRQLTVVGVIQLRDNVDELKSLRVLLAKSELFPAD